MAEGSTNGCPRCGAKTRPGHPCRKPAGWGTDHVGTGNCKLHFGATPNGRTHAARQAAALEAARLGMAIETDPHEALSTVVGILAGQVSYLQGKVAKLGDDEGLSKGDLHPTLRALNSVLDQWRSSAKTAVDAGVEARRLELDELVLDRLASFLRAVLGELDLTEDQQARVPAAMEAHRELLDALGDRPRELAA